MTFRVANNINAAKQAEKLGAKVSKLVGERSFASTEPMLPLMRLTLPGSS